MLHLLALAALATPPTAVADPRGDSDPPEAPAELDHPHAIIHGDPAEAEDYPMAGALMVYGLVRVNAVTKYPFSMFICTGTLIAPDVVLTAAHCLGVEDLEEELGYRLDEPALVFLREVDVSEWEVFDEDPKWPRNTGIGHAWTAHPDYDPDEYPYSPMSQYDDIGLVWLDEPIEGELSYLPTAEEGARLRESDPVEVVGWGQRSATAPGSVGVKTMGQTTISILKPWAMKVGELEEDVRKCHGDSGGPTFARFDTAAATDLRQVGVTSHAYDSSDCEETGGVDTRVDLYLDWIEAELVAGCTDGTRSWCDVPGIPAAPLPGEEPPSVERPGLCSSGPGGAGAVVILLASLVARRRRRDAIESPRSTGG